MPRARQSINPYRTGTGSDEASDGHLIIRLLGSRLRNEWTARDLRGSAKPIDAKDSKLSQMDMNEPRSTVWSVSPSRIPVVTWHTP